MSEKNREGKRTARERLAVEREKQKAAEKRRRALIVGASVVCVLGLAAVIGVVAANAGKDDDGEASGPVVAPSGALGKDSLTIPVGKDAAGVAVGEGSVWVVRYAGVNGWRSELLRIDPSSNKVVGEPIRLGGAAWQVTFGDGAVWLNHSGYDSTFVKDAVYKIDPRTGRVVEIPSSNITMLEVNNGNVWVVAYTSFGGHFYLSRLLVR